MAHMDAGRFFVRPMELHDTEALYDWLQDLDDLSLFDRTMTIPPAKEALRESWKPELAGGTCPTAFWFTVETVNSVPVAIGGLQTVNYAHGDAVMPIIVAKAARGGGLGLRIACLLLDLAFDRLRLRRVTTYFRADNERSARLVRRVGFEEEGRMRQAWLVDARYVDSVVVGLLREEWRARREVLRAGLDDRVTLTFGRSEPGAAGRAEARPAPLKVG